MRFGGNSQLCERSYLSKEFHMRLLPIAASLAAFASAAAAQVVYKYSDQEGRVLYTDKPAAGQSVPDRLEMQPQPGGKPAAGLSEAERQLLETANRRPAELDRAAVDVVNAQMALSAVEARRAQSTGPLEGERFGRRYRPEYRERQQALARDVEEAQAGSTRRSRDATHSGES